MNDTFDLPGYEVVKSSDTSVTVRCLECGDELTSVGRYCREAILAAAPLHVEECADLQAVQAQLEKADDEPADLEHAEAAVMRFAEEGSSRIMLAGMDASFAAAQQLATVMDAISGFTPGGDAA